MKKIEGELSTRHQININSFEGDLFKGEMKAIHSKEWNRVSGTVSKVRTSEGYPIKNFRELIDEVALVTISNKNYEMFYRGQSRDYLNNQAIYYSERKRKSTIMPTICRPELKPDLTPKYSIRKKKITERYSELYDLINFINKQKGSKFMDEYLMALFQHYEILPTPLIDITQSLRVAATFALEKNQKGYLYVFGLPFPNQSISYFIDSEIILLKLQNIMLIDCLRPRYQEGYLVGKFPFSSTKTAGDDLANRLVAKFYIDNTDGKFWDEHFIPMPVEVLYPENDPIEKFLKQIKNHYDSLK